MIANPKVGMRVLYHNRLAVIIKTDPYSEIRLDVPWNGFTRWIADLNDLTELTPEAQEIERRKIHADKYL